MKKFPSLLTLILVVLAIYWAFESLMPSYDQGQTVAETKFSTDRALTHVKAVSQDPHGVGSKGHADVRKYIMEELQKMGLKPTIQEGHTVGDWANLSKAINIMARIEGKDTSGKALLLLTHYDSSPHSSLGASDAGSGVATLLEGVRAFLAQKVVPKNDIIILITDAEELGLNGADLFVNQHPWAKEVGLVLNFEARGSGGPSYMLIETNGGNAHLIEEFTRASPQFPVANSLMYSIYKMLPNDTDLTVFREDGDIEGFNFAFIDDHFDYHTVRDNYERLDRNTLAHQGSYLMPLVSYFAQADLNGLKSDRDLVYFSFPFFGLVSFPFTWIWPLFMIGLVFFVLLVAYGFKEG
ncbi:MAG: M28 family peptidase, partial [Flavobacteriaceae bacterium]